MASIGDYEINDPNHHGTPAQRQAAAYIGLNTAFVEGQTPGVYTYAQLHQIFINAIDAEVINDRVAGAHLRASTGASSPEVVAALEQLPLRTIREIALGRNRGPNIEAIHLSPRELERYKHRPD